MRDSGRTCERTVVIPETTNELDPLKGLTRLLTLVEVMKGGGENH